MTFGTRLRTARDFCGLSKEQVYGSIKLPVSSLSAYEADISAPDPETVNDLVKLYQVSPYFICGLTDVCSPLVWGDNLVDLSPLSADNKRLCKELIMQLFKVDAARSE